jgi:hypothetical protein
VEFLKALLARFSRESEDNYMIMIAFDLPDLNCVVSSECRYTILPVVLMCLQVLFDASPVQK